MSKHVSPSAEAAGLGDGGVREPVGLRDAGGGPGEPVGLRDAGGGPGEPVGLRDAVAAYEAALMGNDLAALDGFFAPGPDTVRGDAAGMIVGHEAISRFRLGRGGAPSRVILSVLIRAIDARTALVISVFAPVRGGRGQQTQLWRRDATGWVIDAAHVSAPPPAIDPSVWRVVGTPLVRGAGDVDVPLGGVAAPAAFVGAGSLAGLRVAVKDLFDVAGHPVGGGVPAFLAEAAPATEHAPAVAALLAAGADVTGIARTDEFAYSVAGRNPHYGTPPNPAVVGGIPGGSSNGPASAVALGQADIGLGTDTGGSIRVPASYQGLWGLRTTHGAVDRGGLLPLAPSFDTVGWLTRDAATLRAAAASSLAAQEPLDVHFAVAPAVTALADPDVASAITATFAGPTDAGLLGELAVLDLGDVDHLFETFRTVQAAEAWRTHGPWIEAHPGALGADIAARFAWASTITADHEASARRDLAIARARLDEILGERVLLIPSASSVAPSTMADAASNERTRAGTLRLTCIAGITGRPALSAPLVWVPREDAATPAPVGLCLVGPRYSDLALIDAAERLAAVL